MESRGEGSGDDDEEEKVEDKASGDSPQPKSIYSPNKGGPRHTAIEAPEPMTIMWVLKHVCQMNLGKALADRREKIRRHAAATSASSKDLIYEMAKFIVMPNGELMPGLDMKSMSFSEQKLHDEHAHQTVKTRRLVRFDPNTGQADVPISRAETMRRLSSFNVGREGDSLSPSASVSAPQTPMAGPTPSMLQTASMLQREMRPSLETAAQATGLTQEAIEKALKKGKKIFMPQETEETEKSLYKRYIIPPDSDLKTRINLIVAFLILYSVISTPFRLGFDYPATGGWYVFDWMCDIGFFIDIAVNFRTAFVDVSGVVETVPNAIANNYLKGWFTIDFVSTVPIDFVIGQLVGGGGQTLRALKLVRILRLVRLLKLARLEDVMENSGQQAGAHFGRRTVENMCVLNSLTGLSSNVANGVQFASLTWGTRASAKCYPPLTGCVTGNETACEAAGDGNKEEKDECLLSDGSVITPRRRVSLYAIGRNSVAKALLRYFLVPAAVASLVLCTFVMHPIDDLSSRYSANSGLLISTVLFHLSITSTAFRSSRFTRFDRVMISVYGLLWLTLAFNATLYYLNRRSWMKINRRKYRSYARTLNIVIGVYLALSTFVNWFAVAFVSPTSDLASPYLTLFFYALLPVVGTVAHFTYLRRLLPLVGPRHAQPSERYHDMEYGVEMQGPSSGFPSDRDLAAEHSALLLPGGYQQRSVPSAASERHSRSHLMLGSSDGISNRDED